MKKILVDIPERKYVPTLGKGPHYDVYLRKDLVNCLRSYGFIVQVKEEGKKKLKVDIPVQPKVEAEHIEEVKEAPAPVVEQPVVKEETPVAEQPIVKEEAPKEEPAPAKVEETISEQPAVEEVSENVETTTTTVDKEGSYETTTGRLIEISESDYALLTKEGVTKQELKDLLEAKGFKTLYKDTLADLFAKFKIEYQK